LDKLKKSKQILIQDRTFVKGVVGGLDPLNQEQILQIITKYSGSLAPKVNTSSLPALAFQNVV